MMVMSYAITLITVEYALLQLQFQFQLIHHMTIGQMTLFNIILPAPSHSRLRQSSHTRKPPDCFHETL